MASLRDLYLPKVDALPLELRVKIISELGSLTDILHLAKSSTYVCEILKINFDRAVLPVFKRSVRSDFRQLIWAIFDLRRQKDKPKGAELAKFLQNLGDCRYPLWPEWAPKDRSTIYQLTILIDNAGFFATMKQACREFEYEWQVPLARPIWSGAVTIPRHDDLPFYIFELYATLFHFDCGSLDPADRQHPLEWRRVNDQDLFLSFFGERAPPSKYYPQDRFKDTMARFHHPIWFFAFLHKLLHSWIGASPWRRTMPNCKKENQILAAVGYQMSLGMSHMRNMLKLGVPAHNSLRFFMDRNFLPRNVQLFLFTPGNRFGWEEDRSPREIAMDDA